MSFHQQRRTRFRGASVVGGAVLIVLLIVVALARPDSGSQGVLSVGSALLRVRATAGEGARLVGGLLTPKSTLVEENRMLREEVATLRAKAELFDDAESAYDELYMLVSGHTLVTPHVARVLASPGVAPYDVFLLDSGSSDGIAVGDVVATEGDIVLGRIDMVSAHTSRVVLFSSPEQEEPAVLTSALLPTTAFGGGGGAFVLRIPKDIPVAPGDVIRRASGGDIMAQVVEAATHDTDAFQTVRAAVPVNIYERMYVFVEPSREE